MEVRHIREKVCKGGTDRTPDVFVFGPATGLRAAVRREAAFGLSRATAALAAASEGPGRPLKVQFVLELFCGSARWSRAMGRLGFYIVAIDLRYGAKHDITRVELRRHIIGWVQARWELPRSLAFRAPASAVPGTCPVVRRPSARAITSPVSQS